MNTQDASRLKRIFAVYRRLSVFDQKQIDDSARRQAERHIDASLVDDRPSLVGMYEAEVSKVRVRLWEEAMLRNYPSKIQEEADAAPSIVKDPTWPGWPGFIPPERRLKGPPTTGTQASLQGPAPIADVLPRFGHDAWEDERE